MKFIRYSFTQLSMVLLAVTIMSVSVLGNSAYSSHVAGGGSTLDIVATEGSNTINISGTTDRSDEVIVKVLAPNRNIVSIDQITPTGGSFATTIETSGALWSQDGTYTITATQTSNGLNSSTETFNRAVDVTGGGLANYQNSAEVEILDGHVVPEFGVIAAMILAVAIVSIIVVTAKTKLSLVPRY